MSLTETLLLIIVLILLAPVWIPLALIVIVLAAGIIALPFVLAYRLIYKWTTK